MSDSVFRKELAARLAETLGDSTTLPLLQLLCNSRPHVGWQKAAQALNPFASFADDVLGLMSYQATDRPTVGIWEQEPGTGDFVRSPAHIDLWQFCADVERIPRKGARRRVAFLGESVARGFFFDPFYSPATVLQELCTLIGSPLEIVDLAQSNSDPLWLSAVAFSTQLLEVDAIVVFAGNNWWGAPLANISAEHCVVEGDLLTRDRGFSELLDRHRRKLDSLAAQTITQISLAAADAGVPLILLVPEINVADWTTCPVGTLDTPLMCGEDTVKWIGAYRRACAAMQRGAAGEAQQFALEAVEIDGATSAASLDLLSRAQLQQGHTSEAAQTHRRSRDLTLCYLDGTRPVPGIFSNVAETIRRVGLEVGATIIDLPRMFADYYPDDEPGRRLFLDYCHLTPVGIRIAMAATAQAVTRILGGGDSSDLGELVDKAPSPSPEQEGWAHLLAGVHNAHWGQDFEICAYHFKSAVEFHPPLKTSALPQLYDAFRRAVPPPLLSSFDDLVRNEIAAVYLLGYGTMFRTVGLINEFRLLTSLRAAVPALENESVDPDSRLGDVSEIDLLSSHWAELTDGNRWFNRAFTAAYALDSSFLFACDRHRPLSIRLTCRVPGAREIGEVVIELNGQVIGSVATQDKWIDGGCIAESSLVTPGLNQLVLRWPNVDRRDLRPALRRNFDTGQPLDLRTHFGEVHDLRICVA